MARQPEHTKRRVAVLVTLALVLGAACDGPTGGDDPARSETKRMLATITAPATAAVYVAEKPFAPSETVRLVDEAGGEMSFTTKPEGDTWFFLVDLYPEERRAHPVKWVFLSDTEVQWYDREWFTRLEDSGGWEAVRLIDVGENPAAVIRPVPKPAGSVEPATGAAMRTISQTAKKKKAVVIDGGDEWIQFPTGLTRDELWAKFERIDSKIEFARQAELFADALKTHGYTVERLSGLDRRIDADLKVRTDLPTLPTPTGGGFAKAIADQAVGLGPGDELVVYFGGHGNQYGVALSDKRFGVDLLTYQELNAALEKVAPGVKKVVILDSCASGAAADHLKGVELHYAARGPLPGVKDEKGEPDKGGKARVGLGAEESYTETLVDALGKPGEVEDPIGVAAIFADIANSDRGAATVTRSGGAPVTPAKPTIDLNGILDQVRTQWAEQNPGLTMNAPACTPSGTVEIPATVACTYTDSVKNAGKISLEVKADRSWVWRSNATAWQMDHLRTVAQTQYRAQVGRSMGSISCSRTGLLPVSTSTACSYTDTSTGGPGTLTFSVAADGSWRWEARPTSAAVTTTTPPAVRTAAPTAAPAACDNPYSNTSWTGTLDLDFYGEQHYTTTITFRFGSPRSGDCESVPVASASVSDGSRSYTLDAAQSHMGCAYHRAAPVGTGAYARCETMEFNLKLRLASGPNQVGRFSVDPISVRIQQGGSRVLTPTQISGPGGAGCCEWGTFRANR